MFSKKYMYDPGQRACLELLEEGFVKAFEEFFDLMNMNKLVRKEAEYGIDKIMPQNFRMYPEIIQFIIENLKDAEEAARKSSFEKNHRLRIKLGKHFQQMDGYQWLADYFYRSCHTPEIAVDKNLIVASLEQQALLEEDRGNSDIALEFLEEAFRIIKKNDLKVDEDTQNRLNKDLCRIYRTLGTECLENENDIMTAKNSKALKYLKKATNLAKLDDNVENQAICHAFLGKAMMKYGKDEAALKNFKIYMHLCEEYNDLQGICQGYFAISEIFKKNNDINKSTEALNTCLKLAKENNFDIIFVFASISLGQIATNQKQYFIASEHFKEALHTLTLSNEHYSKKNDLMKMCKVMYGIGEAHMTFDKLITTLRSPGNISLLKLFCWKNIGGAFSEQVLEKQKHSIHSEETDQEVDETSMLIEKLMEQELTLIMN